MKQWIFGFFIYGLPPWSRVIACNKEEHYHPLAKCTLSGIWAKKTNIVKKRQRQAGVRDCAPHDFRRTFGTELLRQGIDLPTVQRLMGHSDPSTTARYDVRESEEDRRATRGLHLPVVDPSK